MDQVCYVSMYYQELVKECGNNFLSLLVNNQNVNESLQSLSSDLEQEPSVTLFFQQILEKIFQTIHLTTSDMIDVLTKPNNDKRGPITNKTIFLLPRFEIVMSLRQAWELFGESKSKLKCPDYIIESKWFDDIQITLTNDTMPFLKDNGDHIPSDIQIKIDQPSPEIRKRVKEGKSVSNDSRYNRDVLDIAYLVKKYRDNGKVLGKKYIGIIEYKITKLLDDFIVKPVRQGLQLACTNYWSADDYSSLYRLISCGNPDDCKKEIDILKKAIEVGTVPFYDIQTMIDFIVDNSQQQDMKDTFYLGEILRVKRLHPTAVVLISDAIGARLEDFQYVSDKAPEKLDIMTFCVSYFIYLVVFLLVWDMYRVRTLENVEAAFGTLQTSNMTVASKRKGLENANEPFKLSDLSTIAIYTCIMTSVYLWVIKATLHLVSLVSDNLSVNDDPEPRDDYKEFERANIKKMHIHEEHMSKKELRRFHEQNKRKEQIIREYNDLKSRGKGIFDMTTEFPFHLAKEVASLVLSIGMLSLLTFLYTNFAVNKTDLFDKNTVKLHVNVLFILFLIVHAILYFLFTYIDLVS